MQSPKLGVLLCAFEPLREKRFPLVPARFRAPSGRSRLFLRLSAKGTVVAKYPAGSEVLPEETERK